MGCLLSVKRKVNIMRNRNQGFTLVEVMVAVAIMGFISAATLYLANSFQRSYTDLQIKADFISSQNLIQNNFIRNADCDCLFKGKTFNANDPAATIDLNEIRNGCAPDSVPLVVKKGFGTDGQIAERIYISNITPTGNSEEYNAKVNIVPVQLADAKQSRSIPLFLRFNTDPRTPTNGKAILGCGPAPLSIPTGLNARSQEKSCALDWVNSSGAGEIRYIVKYSETAGQSATKGINGCPPETFSNSCITTGLTDGTTYYFSVQALNNYGSTEFSTEIACTPATPPTEINELTAIPGLKNCHLHWKTPNKGTAPLQYKIYRSQIIGQDLKDQTLVCTTEQLECKAEGLSEDLIYYFTGIATNKGGTSEAFSPPVQCQPSAVPSPAQDTKAVGGNSSCQLSWSPPLKGATPFTYSILRSETSGAAAKSGVAVGNCTDLSSDRLSCLESGLVNHRRYYYTVKTTNSVGESYSSEMMCEPGIPPENGIALTATAENGQCRLNWSEPKGDNPMYYTIFKSEESVATEPPPTTEPPPNGGAGAPAPGGQITEGGLEAKGEIICRDTSQTECLATGLTNGKTYRFWGEVANAYGAMDAANKASCTPKD